MTKEQKEEFIKENMCDGFCYGGIDENGKEIPICNGIDTCPVTRQAEGRATCLVVLSIAFIILLAIIGLGYIAIKWFITFIISVL